jgi:hypothetical protein
MDEKPARGKDRSRNRSDIGKVEFPIEKLMKFREASASCVHIEASMEANRSLIAGPLPEGEGNRR